MRLRILSIDYHWINKEFPFDIFKLIWRKDISNSIYISLSFICFFFPNLFYYEIYFKRILSMVTRVIIMAGVFETLLTSSPGPPCRGMWAVVKFRLLNTVL